VSGEFPVSIVALLAALGAGLAAGVFLAFSTFVMTGLSRAPVAVGVSAMQEINRAAPNPFFMITLFGTGLLAAASSIGSAVLGGAGWPWLAAGTVSYLVCLVLTATYHVPRNNALMLVDPGVPATAAAWRTYLLEWTRMNHVRTLSAALGCLLLIMGWSR